MQLLEVVRAPRVQRRLEQEQAAWQRACLRIVRACERHHSRPELDGSRARTSRRLQDQGWGPRRGRHPGGAGEQRQHRGNGRDAQLAGATMGSLRR